MSIVYFIIAILANMLVGAIVCSILDTPDRIFYKWYKDCPFPGFGHAIILTLWPAMAVLMIVYKRRSRNATH